MRRGFEKFSPPSDRVNDWLRIKMPNESVLLDYNRFENR
ncbi:hypothetical protein [Vibrio sp. AND4]|nr:hypothetical protein [Vibrio sp. AND4]